MSFYDNLVSRLGLARFRHGGPRKANGRLNGKPTHPVGQLPTKPRIKWGSQPEACDIVKRHYATTKPEIIAAMVAPYFPGHTVTRNMVIGRANRTGLCKERSRGD